jgi:hypothetical protein
MALAALESLKMAMARYQYQWRISWLMQWHGVVSMAVGANENGEMKASWRIAIDRINTHREKINQSKIWHEKKAKAGVSKAKAQTQRIENKQLIIGSWLKAMAKENVAKWLNRRHQDRLSINGVINGNVNGENAGK